MKKSPGFCAICVAETTELVLRPLGRNDALVRVCTECDGEQPVAKVGRDRGYQPSAGMSLEEMNRKLSAIARDAPLRFGKSRNEMCRAATPGWIIVRVRRRDEHGKPRDNEDAAKLLAGAKWARDLRYLGADARFFLFERPNPKITNLTPSTNPLAAIEQFRVPTHRVDDERVTSPERRLEVSERRKALKAANKCINGPLEDRPGKRRGIVHGPPVGKCGRCQRCLDARNRVHVEGLDEERSAS